MSDKLYNTDWRVINPDGSVNIQKVGQSGIKHSSKKDLYHYLLSISSKQFFGIIVFLYLVINLIFAALYFATPFGSLTGLRYDSPLIHFLDCFFFSAQTIVTKGFGRIAPFGIGANFLVTIEAFLGMLSLAIVAGLFYARFSRPTSRVIFSKNALITTHNGKPTFMFRVANGRRNQIVEANMGVTLVKSEKTLEGKNFRRLYDLKLQKSHSAFFPLSWTVIHVIDDQSPLKALQVRDLTDLQVEIIITLSGIDETMAQNINSRHSYTINEILFDRYFKDMIIHDGQKRVKVDLNAIDELE